jgi:ribonuclease D
LIHTTYIDEPGALASLCTDLLREPIVAVDVESNGLFAYTPRLCVVQIATPVAVFVIDSLKLDVAGLAEVFRDGPATIVHDLGFDARMLHRAGAPLCRVHDTALAASLLGRPATGLGSVLKSELGLTVDKSLQHADWAKRPLGERELEYLATDVVHLFRLWEVLSAEAEAKGITSELTEETRYRLAEAARPGEDDRPALARLKGVDRAKTADLPLLRALTEAREELARSLDVPAYKVVNADVLFAVAAERPTSLARLERIPGAHRGRGRALSRTFLELVQKTHPPLTAEELAAIHPTKLPEPERRERRAREDRLTAWRKAEAERREVSPQVVLPGHVLRRLSSRAPKTVHELANVDGLGSFRVERYGDALLSALAGPETP